MLSTTAEDDDKADQHDDMAMDQGIKLMLLSVGGVGVSNQVVNTSSHPLTSMSLQDADISAGPNGSSSNNSDSLAPGNNGSASLTQRSFANAIQLFPPLGIGAASMGSVSTWGSLDDDVPDNGAWS